MFFFDKKTFPSPSVRKYDPVFPVYETFIEFRSRNKIEIVKILLFNFPEVPELKRYNLSRTSG